MYQLIPLPELVRQTTLVPCPAVTWTPLEAYKLLWSKSDLTGVRSVYTRFGYMDFLTNGAERSLDPANLLGLAASEMGFASGLGYAGLGSLIGKGWKWLAGKLHPGRWAHNMVNNLESKGYLANDIPNAVESNFANAQFRGQCQDQSDSDGNGEA